MKTRGAEVKVRHSAAAGRVPATAPGRPTCATHATHLGSCSCPSTLPAPVGQWPSRKGVGEVLEGHEMGCPPPGRTHIIEEAERALMAR